MLTRSKCMAAPEAAGEKNWEMESASDTFHPPTTVVATPDPILIGTVRAAAESHNCYYFKLYNITTLVAKCRIDSFRLRGSGSMRHMFLLNIELGNACRFRVFHGHFLTVSRFPFPRFQSTQC